MVLNAPSIKNFIPSEAVNVFPLLLFLLFFLTQINLKLSVNKELKLTIICVFIFFTYLLLYGLFMSLDSFSLFTLIKYIVIMATVILATLLANRNNIRAFLYICLIWGLFMAFAVIIEQISLARLHYLQIGHPVAIAVIISGVFYFKNDNISNKILFISISIFCLFTLSTLYGRSPFLFSLIVILSLCLLYLHRYKKSIFVIAITLLSLLFVTAYNVIISILPQHIGIRVLSLLEGENNRYELWSSSIQYIIENPFGYGLESSWHLIGYYPHNFMLEIMLSSGIVGLIPVLCIFILFFNAGVKSVSLNVSAVAIFGVGLYYFFRSLIGVSIDSSYDLLITISLAIAYISYQQRALKGFIPININK